MQTVASPDPVSAPKAYQDLLVSLVGDDDPADVQAETVPLIRELLADAGADTDRRPEDSEWSVSECLAHMLDAELVVSGRYRWILAHDRPELVGYDQDLWVNRLHQPVEDPGRAAGDVRGPPSRQPGAVGSHPCRTARSVRDPSRARSGELRADLHAGGRARSVPPRPGSPRPGIRALSRAGHAWYRYRWVGAATYVRGARLQNHPVIATIAVHP